MNVRLLVALGLVVATCSPAFAAEPTPLARRADAVIARLAPAESHVGVSVVDVTTGETLYASGDRKLYAPASLVKLATSAAALAYMGTQRRFQTRLLADGAVTGGILRGHLYLKGEGDPTLAVSNLDALASALKAQGVKTVTGDVVADAGLFQVPDPGAPGWSWDDLGEPYARPIGALTLTSANPSAKPAGNPALETATAMKAALERQGIAMHGGTRLGTTPAGARTVAAHASAPLADVVREMNKQSDNMIAETLLFHLGVRGHGAPGTREKGLKTLRAFLERAGWTASGYRLEDGAGLSTYDALTPAQLTALLRTMPAEPLAYPAYVISLPVGGVDGTLAKRLADPAVRGRLRAKTGTMSGVSGLAGYMVTDSGRTVALAIMINGFVGSADRARALQDELVKAIAEADEPALP